MSPTALQARVSLKHISTLLLALFFLICVVSLYAYLRNNPILGGSRFLPEGGLPNDYIWKHNEGEDFDIYYGKRLDNENSGVNIYLGYWPNFPYADDSLKKEGRVLGSKVFWIVLDGSKETGYEFYRTTLLSYRYLIYHPVYVHISVYAKEEELRTILDSLESLRIRPTVTLPQALIQRLLQNQLN